MKKIKIFYYKSKQTEEANKYMADIEFKKLEENNRSKEELVKLENKHVENKINLETEREKIKSHYALQSKKEDNKHEERMKEIQFKENEMEKNHLLNKIKMMLSEKKTK